jgi:hypothetical protein
VGAEKIRKRDAHAVLRLLVCAKSGPLRLCEPRPHPNDISIGRAHENSPAGIRINFHADGIRRLNRNVEVTCPRILRPFCCGIVKWGCEQFRTSL